MTNKEKVRFYSQTQGLGQAANITIENFTTTLGETRNSQNQPQPSFEKNGLAKQTN
jgi:hypothetical protein